MTTFNRRNLVWSGLAMCFGNLQGLPAAVGDDRTSASTQPSANADYHDSIQLSSKLHDLVEARGEIVSLEEIGKSVRGQSLWALRVCGPGPISPQQRAALLVAAGIDGRHTLGSEIALRVAERLAAATSQPPAEGDQSPLSRFCVYVIPRVNPDAQGYFFARPLQEHNGNARPADDDRDGVTDEDPPDDLNGDGMITLMRVEDPEGEYLPDPAAPRLMKKADRALGEKGLYKLHAEGRDDDNDGEVNEDPIGGVALNRNFMHRYDSSQPDSGRYPVSEPESLALLRFVLDHPRIAAVLVYGVHDNLVEAPDAKERDITGKAPKRLDSADAPIYAEIGKKYRELTQQKRAEHPDDAGAFFAWAYAQYGIPSFAVSVWGRPEVDAKKETADPGRGWGFLKKWLSSEVVEALRGDQQAPKKDSASETEKPDDAAAGSQPATSPAPTTTQAQQPAAAGAGHANAESPQRRDKDAKPGDAAAAEWLRYSDEQCGGKGFIEWAPYDHPTLGRVEIGGFVPCFQTDPPPETLDGLAEKQAAFVLDLLGRLPWTGISDVRVAALGTGVYEITAYLRNEGYFPTALEAAKTNRRVRPILVRLDLPKERILAGDPLVKVWSLEGSGGAHELRWVVRGEDGQSVDIVVQSERFNEYRRAVPLAGATPAENKQ